MTKVYNRKTKQIEKVKHFGGTTLDTIYQNPFLTKILINKFISKCYGFYQSTIFSKQKIKKFIQKNQIDMNLYKEENYSCFNDFFIRKLKNIKIEKDGFISPCDGKLLVYQADSKMKYKIKNHLYTIEELIHEKIELKNSTIFIYRLSLDNYHRFHYIDDGKRIKTNQIKGKLHTVSHSSDQYKIYQENERIYSILDTKHFGKIIYIEVGALLVGKIKDYDYESFKRGQEKGYFLPGGSTIIIIANDIKVDQDIIKNSKKNIETIVSVGEKVGEKRC